MRRCARKRMNSGHGSPTRWECGRPGREGTVQGAPGCVGRNATRSVCGGPRSFQTNDWLAPLRRSDDRWDCPAPWLHCRDAHGRRQNACCYAARLSQLTAWKRHPSVTVNDYLARRDARWMAPIYHMLGLSVGVLQMAAVTENGKKAFIVISNAVTARRPAPPAHGGS